MTVMSASLPPAPWEQGRVYYDRRFILPTNERVIFVLTTPSWSSLSSSGQNENLQLRIRYLFAISRRFFRAVCKRSVRRGIIVYSYTRKTIVQVILL